MLNNIEILAESKKLPAILLMFGEEEFLLEHSYDKLIKSLVSNRSSNYDFEVYDAENTDVKTIVDNCSVYPFISERRIIVINHFEKFFTGRQSKKSIEKSPIKYYLENPQDTTFLILKAEVDKLNGLAEASKTSVKSDKALKIIKAAGFPYDSIVEKFEWIKFPKVYESGYPSFVKKLMKSYGKEITTDAIEILLMHIQPNLREIYNELEKVIIYIGDKTKIEADDVSFIVGKSKVYNVFELQKAVGNRDINYSLEILQNMLNSDNQEMLIMTMLTKYFIVIWKLIEESAKGLNNYQLAANVGVRPFFLNDYINVLKKYNPEEIERAFLAMAEADEKLKSSSTNKLIILQKMLIEIMA